MNRGLRVYIFYYPKLLILINNIRFQFTFDNFAKNIRDHAFNLFFTSSTIFSNGIVSWVDASMSLSIIVLSNASFLPSIRVNLTPKRCAILNCDLMLSRPREDLVSTPAFLKASNSNKLFLLAGSPGWTRKTLGFGLRAGTDTFFSFRSMTNLSRPTAQPADGVLEPPSISMSRSYLPPATIVDWEPMFSSGTNSNT